MTGLAEILRAARLSAGLTQRQVADALAVPHTYPSRWERGATRPGPANLLALAELYRLDAVELLRLYAEGPAAGRRPGAAGGGGPAQDGDAAAAAALGRAVTDAVSESTPTRRRRGGAGGAGRAAGASGRRPA